MKSQELKNLIKEAVREVLKEELAELGKQKIQESFTSKEEWPTLNFNTTNTTTAAVDKSALRQSLMDQMGISAPIETSIPKTFSEKQNVYKNMLDQVASEMRQNPADLSNFKNVQ